MEGVFVHSEDPDSVQVTYAKHAYQRVEPATGQRTLVLLDGHNYRIALDEGRDRVLKFEQMEMRIKEEETTPEYRRKAASTRTLARSTDSMDMAELQWRLTTPLSTVLLALLGVPLSRSVPRQGRYARFGTAVLVYAAYYNVKAMAKTWLEHGTVGPLPGLWWVDALLAVVVLVVLWRPWGRLR
jgi:lipopolysaccharide export system permease protein